MSTLIRFFRRFALAAREPQSPEIRAFFQRVLRARRGEGREAAFWSSVPLGRCE